MRLLVGICLLVAPLWAQAEGDGHCTDSKAYAVCEKSFIKEQVDWACKQLKQGKKKGFKAIRKHRFNCCGEKNYVWIQDLNPDDPKMLLHPTKPILQKKSLKDFKNKHGKGENLFAAFVKAVLSKPNGSWVQYMWTKAKEEDPSQKESWVKQCEVDGEKVLVGSGTWSK